MSKRPNLGFTDALDSLHTPLKDEQKQRPKVAKDVAMESGFSSREVATNNQSKGRRKKRQTYRTVQVNCRAKEDISELFYSIADENGWSAVETFERAVIALKTSTQT